MNSFLGRSYSEAESVITPDNSVYDQAFIQLIQEIHEPLNQGQVFYTSDLCAKYKEFLRQREIITSYKTNNLIQRFYSHYGPNIQIVPQKGTSSILCSADISVAQLFKEIGKLQENDTQVDFSDTEENEIPHNLEFNRMSFHSAKRIREAVKDMGKQVTSNQTLPVELELSYESAAKLVPNSLYNHLAWLFNRFVRRCTCIR